MLSWDQIPCQWYFGIKYVQKPFSKIATKIRGTVLGPVQQSMRLEPGVVRIRSRLLLGGSRYIEIWR